MSEPGDLWRRADEALDRALDLSVVERGRFLAGLHASDPEAYAEVVRLLDAHDRSERFLDESAPVFAADLLPDLAPSTPDLAPGTRIGGYSIIERIGSGGMGVVYKALDERLDRFVALKFLASNPGAGATDEDARSRLLAEAKIAGALDHPGIAVVHEIAETRDHGIFVAMAFYGGATLKDHLRDGPLPLETCVDFARQIAAALAAAHRHGIVHRDMKPANVIVTEQGVAKIVDFGIARIAPTPRSGGSASAGTSTDPARGSPGYMSPEQRRGDEVDARADIWSFGVLVHEMLTGRRPPEDGALDPAVPARFRPLLARCLETDPEKRYGDASALMADLRAAAGDERVAAGTRSPWPAAATAVGILGLVAAAVLVILERSPPQIEGTTGGLVPIPGIDVTTTSLVAYRFYQEGQRSYASGDLHNAVRLFDAALAEDSAFAMAAYYGWVARAELGQPTPPGVADDLARMAEDVSDAERRQILGVSQPGLEPTDYEGFLARGNQRLGLGDAAGAISDFRSALALASSEEDGPSPTCRACTALAGLVGANHSADSLEAAERAAREWVRRDPGSARAWRSLSRVLVAAQQWDDAAAANLEAVELSPGWPDDVLLPATSRIPRGDFATADRLLTDLARDGSSIVRVDAEWFLTISLRYQGRLEEALEAIGRNAAVSFDTVGARLHRGQVLLEMGRVAEAAAAFDSSARFSRQSSPEGWAARMEAWSLTHRASAAAALGDTSALALLADSIESVAKRSSFGRDPFLHHHVRGLLLATRGDPEAAVAAFRRAVYSPTVGYTRTNIEMGRLLIELGRPLEAVAILAPALRGGIEASNLYATHTEIHELLGRAWHAAGRPDSAAVHDAWVLSAWERADPSFDERRAAVRRRAAAASRATTRP